MNLYPALQRIEIQVSTLFVCNPAGRLQFPANPAVMKPSWTPRLALLWAGRRQGTCGASGATCPPTCSAN
jgi:hypothetical protein